MSTAGLAEQELEDTLWRLEVTLQLFPQRRVEELSSRLLGREGKGARSGEEEQAVQRFFKMLSCERGRGQRAAAHFPAHPQAAGVGTVSMLTIHGGAFREGCAGRTGLPERDRAPGFASLPLNEAQLSSQASAQSSQG